jgi:hypothetical protein
MSLAANDQDGEVEYQFISFESDSDASSDDESTETELGGATEGDGGAVGAPAADPGQNDEEYVDSGTAVWNDDEGTLVIDDQAGGPSIGTDAAVEQNGEDSSDDDDGPIATRVQRKRKAAVFNDEQQAKTIRSICHRCSITCKSNEAASAEMRRRLYEL